MLQFAFEQDGTDLQMYIHECMAPTMEAAVKTKGHHCHRKEIRRSQVGCDLHWCYY